MKRESIIVATLGFALAWSACSSSNGANDAGTGAGATDCGAKAARRYDGTTCTDATVAGVCTRSLGYNSATLEFVCAAGPDGAMYLLGVNGDTYLSGDGWTFGPREFGPSGEKLYPLEPDTLSPGDEVRCQFAQAACFSVRDAGTNAGPDATLETGTE